jgi:hypothetical protein
MAYNPVNPITRQPFSGVSNQMVPLGRSPTNTQPPTQTSGQWLDVNAPQGNTGPVYRPPAPPPVFNPRPTNNIPTLPMQVPGAGGNGHAGQQIPGLATDWGRGTVGTPPPASGLPGGYAGQTRPLGYADGGQVRGPGGPRQDAVPIMASNGEFVIPADVVQKHGPQYFQQLINQSRGHYADGGLVDDAYRTGMGWSTSPYATAANSGTPVVPPPQVNPLAAGGQTDIMRLGRTPPPNPTVPNAPDPAGYTAGMSWSTSPYSPATNGGVPGGNPLAVGTPKATGAPVTGNPLTDPVGGEPAGNPPPGTGTTPPPPNGNPYGTIGQAGPNPNGPPAGLDDYYRNQWQYFEPGESQPGRWDIGNGMYTDRSGQQVVQIGGPHGEGLGSGHSAMHLNDPSQVHYDPELGWVTSPNNLGNQLSSLDGGDYRSIAAVLGAGLGTAALQGGFAGEAGTGAFDMYGSAAVPGQSGTIFDTAAGATGAGATTAGTTTASSAAGTATPAATGLPSLSQVSSLASNPLVRGAIGLGASALGGGGAPGSGQPGNGTPGGGLGDLVTGGLNLWNDSQSINQFNQRVDDLINRGDYNSQYRPGYLSDLNASYTDPDRFLAPYAAGDARDQSNLSRTLAARGFNLSGNELGDLTRLQSEQRFKHLNDIRADLRSSASLGDPGRMATAGIAAAGQTAQMTANRNAAANALLNRVINGRTVQDWIKGVQNGTISPNDVPSEVNDAVDGWNQGPGNINDNTGGGAFDNDPTFPDYTSPPDTSGGYGDFDWEFYGL